MNATKTTVEYSEGSLAAALATMIPAIKESFKAHVARAWARLMAHPVYSKRPSRASGDWGFYQSYQLVARCLKHEAFPSQVVTLDASLVESVGDKYATEASQGWHDKLAAKLGPLTGATLVYGQGAWLQITGKRDGKTVEINQRMIVNVSPKGKMFNQFPARITLDGKAISEAKYKKEFAA